MDILKLITNKDRLAYAENFQYKVDGFDGQLLFTPQKSKNLEIDFYKMLGDNAKVPVSAEAHAFDTEAKIGDRPNFKKIEFDKILIKEKINQTEKIAQALNHNLPADEIVRFIYDDFGNMFNRVLTKTEIMNMELLATGKVTIRENNINKVIDYQMSTNNVALLGDWTDPTYSILGDLNMIQGLADDLGIDIGRAITSSGMIQNMVANNEIINIFAISNNGFPTRNQVIEFIDDKFGIRFRANKGRYKTSIDGELHRMYPDNRITFMPRTGAIGKGMFGVSPSELEIAGTSANASSRANIYLKQWGTPDPVATWTMAEALYLPVPNDIDSLLIAFMP